MEYLAKAEQFYNNGEYEEALAICDEALRLSISPDPRLYDQRAAVLQRLAQQARQLAMQHGYSRTEVGISTVPIGLDPSEMSLMDLAESCAREMSKYRRKEANNGRYALEIIRRAIILRDDDAWVIFHQQFSQDCHTWFCSHPSRNAVLHYDDEQNYVDESFRRFWQAVGDQQLTFTTLASMLSYLHLCLNCTIMDTLRAFSRPREESILDVSQSGKEELLVEDHYHEDELWEIIDGFLSSEKEKRVAYLHFHVNLKPREIMRLCPGEFASESEIYRIKRNIMERLLRNVDKIRWRLSEE